MTFVVMLWLRPSGGLPEAGRAEAERTVETPEVATPESRIRKVTLPIKREAPTAAPELSATGTNSWRRLLDENAEPEPLPREIIVRWLQLNGTNATSLLAARQAGGGREFLLQALTNFPNDPRVLFAALSFSKVDPPEVVRERLERFKQAAPDSALPNYLSARQQLQAGNPEEALKELTAAAQKNGFQDYVVDAIQNTEELYLAAGKSPVEAKIQGGGSALLPHLAELKDLAKDMAVMQQKFLAAGDSTSAEHLAQYGLQLSQHLTSGEGSGMIIDQLVGLAVARLVLSPLEAETSYHFLPNTPGEQLAEIENQKKASHAATAATENALKASSDLDVANYFERIKIYGERAAMEWLIQRQPKP